MKFGLTLRLAGLAVLLICAAHLRAANPIITEVFTADPAALAHNGRVYLYTGHDEAPIGTEAYQMKNWLCYSSADMVNWRSEGSPMSLSTFSWAISDAWAGQVIERNGKFYWYVPMSHRTITGFAIGVGVADSPTGPFTDARGTALITNDLTADGAGKTNVFSWDDIDPSVFIDDDGQAYLFWGNTICHYVKLKANMIETDGAIQTVSLPLFTEAPWVHKRNGLYYLSYAYGWEEKIAYATSSSITGPWTFRSVINDYVYRCNTNHQAIVDFKGRAYFIYHNGGAPNGGSYHRSVCVDLLHYNADGTIQPIVQTTAGITEAAPEITTQPQSQTVMEGAAATLSVVAAATTAVPTYQWRKNGVDLAGATSSTLTLTSAKLSDAGSYSVVVTTSGGYETSTSAVLTVGARPIQEAVANGDATAQIMNLSTRGIVRPGEEALIAGFVISGPAAKKVLITAWGYSLKQNFGMTGEIGRPQMWVYRLKDGASTLRLYRTSWAPQADEVIKAIFQVGGRQLWDNADPAHGDSAAVLTLEPGVYSVVVEPAPGSANRDGIGLVEIYDMTPRDGSRLVNLSSRGRIEIGDRQMIVGVVVGGSGHARLMIRGDGPTLKSLGVTNALADPSLTLVRNQNGTQTNIATNNDWWNSAQADQSRALAAVLGAFALGENSSDAVILRQFEPGVYSCIIQPSDTTAGVAMAEIYDAYVP